MATTEEFKPFVMALRTYYPKENILPNPQAVTLWYQELQDIPYQVLQAALRKWVATNKWSPSIADIRELSATIQHGEIPEWGEGWEKVLRAVRKYGLYSIGPAMESLDPMTRRAVEQVGFREICLSENIGVERANFRMVYETLAQREKARQQMALPLQQAIDRLGSPDLLRLKEGE